LSLASDWRKFIGNNNKSATSLSEVTYCKVQQ